jgi:hypothetical protein
MSLVNNQALTNYINNYHSQLDNIYVDKFWSSINNKQWVYADDILIEWIGYRKENGKSKYINLIKENFKENEDYKTYNYEEINKVFHYPLGGNENNKEILEFKDKLKDIHNRTIHLILSPKCFKKSLMMIRTEKANSIRDYYVDIEEVCLEFNKFLLEESKMSLEEAKLELKQEQDKNKYISDMTINKSPLLKKESVYAVSTYRYAAQNFLKFGMTTNKLASRTSGYNIGKLPCDRYHVIFSFECIDAKSFELYIFSLLQNFKVNKTKEMFKIHFDLFFKIMDIACSNYNNSIERVNEIIENEQEKYINIKPTIPSILLENGNVGMDQKEIKEEELPVFQTPTPSKKVKSSPTPKKEVKKPIEKKLTTPNSIIFMKDLLEGSFTHNDFDISLNRYFYTSAALYKIYLDYCELKKIHYVSNKIFIKDLKLISLNTIKLAYNKQRSWQYRFTTQEVNIYIKEYLSNNC